MRYIVTRFTGGAQEILKSVSFGNGGYRMRAEWIPVGYTTGYKSVFFVAEECLARAIAGLVCGDVVAVN